MVQHRGFATNHASRVGAGAAPADADVLDALSDGIIVCDANGTICRVNVCAARLVQRLPSDLMGQPVLQCIPTEDLEELASYLAAPEQPGSYEISLKRGDGSDVVVHVGQRPLLPAQGRNAGGFVLLTLTDLSDFQRTHSMLQGRLRELAWFQQVSLDREERILQLKRENDQLRTRLGMPTTQPVRDRLQHELDQRLKG